MNRVRMKYLLCCSIFFSAGILHAQDPPSGSQSTPPPAAAPITSPADSKPAEPAKTAAPATPLEVATQLYRNGKLAEAEAAYKSVVESEPKSAGAYVGLVRVNLRQKKLTEAEAALAKAVELSPNSNAVHIAQGEVHFREGKIDEARGDFTPLVKANVPEGRAYLGLGKVYRASSYYRHAKLMIDLAHEKDPDDPDINRYWIATLSRKERIQALKGILSSEEEEDGDDRNHLETSLAMMEDAAGSGRKGCHLVNKVAQIEIPMERMVNGVRILRGYGLKMQFNGAAATLRIDSGASGILISKKIAEKAGITSIVKTDVHGIGDKGAVASFIGVADSIKIGDLEYQGCHVEVVDRNSVVEEDGLIGSDVFSNYLVGLNFPKWKLELTALPALPPPSDADKALLAKYPKLAGYADRYVAPEFKTYTPIYRLGHMLLIPTRINELPPKLFMIDTGAFSDTISPAAAREVTKVRQDSNIKVKGLNGAVKDVFTADNLTLTFSNFRQPTRDIVAFDTTKLSDSSGVEISGMLGFAMLYQMRIRIDYRDGLVDFAIDPIRVP